MISNIITIYHSQPFYGKFFIFTNKLLNINYLHLCYTPGVGFISNLIFYDFFNIYKYTIKSNLVAVITNGTAVLGLGNIGPLASKPVMEGKSILFKKFADINSFDIEIFEFNSFNLINIILSLESCFGGINLEDIKSPDCFYIESFLLEKSSIPVFHDDQHGTSIVVCSAVINFLILLKKNIVNLKLLVLGAGAASLSSVNILLHLGFLKKNILIFDSVGLLCGFRSDLNSYKKNFINNFYNFLLLEDINFNFDLILGCSKSGYLNSNLLKFLFKNSSVLFLSNPHPELYPEVVKFIRNDLMIFTGRSDYRNQVNNLICFPFIFRGILDSLTLIINNFLKLKCSFILSSLFLNNFLEIRFFYNKFNLNRPSFLYSIISPFDKRIITKIPFFIFKYSVLKGWANNFIKNFYFYIKKLSLINLK